MAHTDLVSSRLERHRRTGWLLKDAGAATARGGDGADADEGALEMKVDAVFVCAQALTSEEDDEDEDVEYTPELPFYKKYELIEKCRKPTESKVVESIVERINSDTLPAPTGGVGGGGGGGRDDFNGGGNTGGLVPAAIHLARLTVTRRC